MGISPIANGAEPRELRAGLPEHRHVVGPQEADRRQERPGSALGDHLRRPTTMPDARFDWLDDRAAERPEWIAAFLEMKTVWHPIGV